MIEQSGIRSIEQVLTLLEDCREFGTLAFSHAARAGFVATTLLRSFVAMGLFNEQRAQAFMNSVSTVAKAFEQSRHAYTRGELPAEELIDEYGHLRPGTYEITTPAYWEDPGKISVSHEPGSN